MADLVDDFDYAKYAGIGGLGAAFKGAIQGWQDAEDRKMKHMEMQSRMDAEVQQRERNKFLDAMTAREKGYQAPTDYSQAPQVDPARQKEMAIEKFAGQNRIPEFDQSGSVTGSHYDPEYLKVMHDKAMFDPFGTKSRPTEGEFSASGFAKRMQDAEMSYQQLVQSGFDPSSGKTMFNEMLGGDSMLGRLSEQAKDPQVKQYEQVKRNFVSAVLRKESGAAISPKEYKEEEKKYFPLPGDPPEVRAQKDAARAQAFENLKAAGGRAFNKIPSVQPPMGKVGGGKLSGGLLSASGSGAPKRGDVQDGYEFLGGDPADSKNWKKK